MHSYKQGRKPKQPSYGVGNNRALTEARKKQRLGTFGSILPRRFAYFLQMLAAMVNDRRAKAREIQAELREFNTPGDMKYALRQLRLVKQQKAWTKATDTANRWDKVKQELLEQNDRALFGHTKRKVAEFIRSLGYEARYSGNLKQMFVVVPDTMVGNTVPQLHELIGQVKGRFSDLPFGIRAGNF